MAKAILFGEMREDGKVLVGSTIHSQPGKAELQASAYPEGYEFDKLPDPPAEKRGIMPVLVFDPVKNEFEWEEKTRPLTDSESIEVQTEAIQNQTAALGVQNTLLTQLLTEMKALTGSLKK